MIQFTAVAIPGHSGMTSGAASEADARSKAHDYAQLLLGNDDARRFVEVTIEDLCWACNGAATYATSPKRFAKRHACKVCKGSGVALEIPPYFILRD